MLHRLLFFLLACFQVGQLDAAFSFSVDYDNGQFLLDGKPFRYISGSIHYFRIHPDQWMDRLKRVRALGFNAIQYYVPWNFHEVEKGQFVFSGARDFARFSMMAESLGMYTLLRIGPYVCAEWENGGLPYWLIAENPDIYQRTSDPRFTSEVSRWFKVLATQIRPLLRQNGGPVLMVQIENEYGMYEGCDSNYTTWMRDLALDLLGSKTVLYTTDGPSENFLNCGAIPGVLATVDFGPTYTEYIVQYFENQKKHLPGGKGPLVNSEYYPGWLVLWGQQTQELPSPEAVVKAAQDMWDLGASFNFYMIYGGTNFGFWNGAETNAPVITSYDYTAPISEAGDYTETYWKIRTWIQGIEGWSNRPTEPPNSNEKKAYPKAILRLVSPISGAMQTESCVTSDDPLSFEDLRQQFGYVMYYTNLNRCGSNLTIENIKDFGYVRVGDKQMKEVFVKEFNDVKVHSVSIEECTIGDRLDILVENQGRLTYETINDFKGILSTVLLDGESLKGWTQCNIGGPYEVELKRLLNERNYENEVIFEPLTSDNNFVFHDLNVPGSSGIYEGTFNVDVVADTWLKMKEWGKGHVIVNGHNVGRHWSTQGPQFGLYTSDKKISHFTYNLYVPAPFITEGENTIVVFEIEGTTESSCSQDIGECYIPFEAQPDISFLSETFYDLHKMKGNFDRRRHSGF